MRGRLRKRVHRIEKAKAPQPPQQAVASAQVRCVKINRCFRRNAVVPDELVLLMQLQPTTCGFQPKMSNEVVMVILPQNKLNKLQPPRLHTGFDGGGNL